MTNSGAVFLTVLATTNSTCVGADILASRFFRSSVGREYCGFGMIRRKHP